MKKLMERIDNEVAYEKSVGNVLDEISWGSQYGILVSVNDADKIVKLAMATESLLFMMGELNCNSYGSKTIEDAINKAKSIFL